MVENKDDLQKLDLMGIAKMKNITSKFEAGGTI